MELADMTAYFRADDSLRAEALARSEMLASANRYAGNPGGDAGGSTAPPQAKQAVPTRRRGRVDMLTLVSAFVGGALALGGAALVSWFA
jgi:hypothetical protein